MGRYSTPSASPQSYARERINTLFDILDLLVLSLVLVAVLVVGVITVFKHL
jgi:hypothetical protein